MLKLRAEQERAIEETSLDDFVSRVAVYLAKHLPSHTAPLAPEALEARIRADIDAAGKFGIDVEPDLAKWCYLSLVSGQNFHESPDIHGLLREPLLAPAAKMEFLMRSLAVSLEKRGAGGAP